jgi:hypothetical protein
MIFIPPTVIRVWVTVVLKEPFLWWRSNCHDNARPHTAKVAVDALTPLQHPPYSPDLVPCNFWAFPTVKRELQGQPPVRGRGMKLTTHLHLVSRSRMCGSIPPFLQYAFIAWCSVKAQGQLYLYFFLIYTLAISFLWSHSHEAKHFYCNFYL